MFFKGESGTEKSYLLGQYIIQVTEAIYPLLP